MRRSGCSRPLYTGQELSMEEWRARMWLGTWI